MAETAVGVDEIVVVEEGDSTEPSYSPQGDRLLFVSGKRRPHAQRQVYEKDLNSTLERRLTYQNGHNSKPKYHPKENWILYASSTDELKENPPLLKNAQTQPVSRLPESLQQPFEIYEHALKGLEIRRLTSRPLFDGEARYSNDGQSLIWTRATLDRAAVVKAPRGGGPAREIKDAPANSSHYAIAPNGKAQAWIAWDESFGVARLMVKKDKAPAQEINSDLIVQKTDLEFTPDNQWLLWAQRHPESTQHSLWGLELSTMCVQLFSFPSLADRRHPIVSPDMQWLTYALDRDGRSRIVKVPFKPRTGPGPCATAKPPVP